MKILIVFYCNHAMSFVIFSKNMKISFKIDQIDGKYWKIQRKPKTEVLYGGSNL